MKSFTYGLAGALSAALAAGGMIGGCASEGHRDGVAVAQAPLTVDELAEQCGLVCAAKGEGIVAGNASISGVASIDAFFGSVVSFDAAAKATASGINAQISAIRGDFGIAADADLSAELQAKLDANLEAGWEIKAQPAECKANVEATLEASAKCDATVDPGKASVQCKGSCEAEVGAELKCEGEAKLECAFTDPSVMCGGSCSGSCTAKLDAQGGCSGTCKGECMGSCEGDTDSGGGCNGTCNGECMGTCEAKLEADGSCMGQCEGECKVEAPEGGCMASAKASCKGSATAMVECKGTCDGDFEPPMAKAECQASAKADAKVNVECTPPSVTIDYKLKAGLDAAASAKFEAGLKSLVRLRLPALVAAIKKGDLVVDAGATLVASAGDAIKGSIDTTLKGKLTAKQAIGLKCAVTELGDVGTVINGATTGLKGSLESAGEVTTACGL